jgi:hypothetical protein
MPQRPPRQRLSSNALGSRNASGSISREQPSERIVAAWGKRPEVVARLPIQIENDKGRCPQQRGIAISQTSQATTACKWFVLAEALRE